MSASGKARVTSPAPQRRLRSSERHRRGETDRVDCVRIVHKTANVLNKLPKSLQAKATRALQDIWMAETKKDALAAFDAFVETYGVKYEGASDTPEFPIVRKIGPADLKDVLRKGFADFWAMPSQVFFIGLIYPIAGVILAGFAFGQNMLPLLYPLASGFALVGPIVSIGLYELSRRREQGRAGHVQILVAADAFQVLAIWVARINPHG